MAMPAAMCRATWTRTSISRIQLRTDARWPSAMSACTISSRCVQGFFHSLSLGYSNCLSLSLSRPSSKIWRSRATKRKRRQTIRFIARMFARVATSTRRSVRSARATQSVVWISSRTCKACSSTTPPKLTSSAPYPSSYILPMPPTPTPPQADTHSHSHTQPRTPTPPDNDNEYEDICIYNYISATDFVCCVCDEHTQRVCIEEAEAET